MGAHVAPKPEQSLPLFVEAAFVYARALPDCLLYPIMEQLNYSPVECCSCFMSISLLIVPFLAPFPTHFGTCWRHQINNLCVFLKKTINSVGLKIKHLVSVLNSDDCRLKRDSQITLAKLFSNWFVAPLCVLLDSYIYSFNQHCAC